MKRIIMKYQVSFSLHLTIQKKSIVIPNAESESHEFVRERSLAGKEKKNYFQKSDEYKNHHKELVKSGIKAINDGILRKVCVVT